MQERGVLSDGFGSGEHLGHSDSFLGVQYLAVEVGDLDNVMVNHANGPYSDSFRHPRQRE